MLTPDNVQSRHQEKRKEIEVRLAEFALIPGCGEAALLSELSFCIAAANSSAEAAGRAQKELGERNLLLSDDASAISAVLLSSHVRFHKNKAKYLIEARRKLFEEKGLEKAIKAARKEINAAGKAIKAAGNPTDDICIRNHLADDVPGLGMKEAGHFLRNAGLANDFAILDRHILANLVSLGVIRRLPRTLTRKRYLAIEKKMMKFCEKSKIPPAHLDLLMWSEQTGRIFK
ncbi:MAG: DNA lyase [Candidatus Micrarchaeota archaeon]